MWWNPVIPMLFLPHLPLLLHVVHSGMSCFAGHCFWTGPVTAPIFGR